MENPRDLGGRLAVCLGGESHLRQGLHIAIQSGYAISVLGTFPVIFVKFFFLNVDIMYNEKESSE